MKKILTLCCAASLALSVSAQNYAPKVQELDRWSFSKDGSTWTEVTVPHSYNAEDGHSASYYRGTATYKREIRLSGKRSFLLLEGAAQAAEIRLDGKTVATHKGGYTPFTVRLEGKGKHVLEVICDNHEDVQLAPVSSDFNKNGGLHNPAHLLEMGPVYFCPVRQGIYRLHVRTPEVSDEAAKAQLSATLVSAGKERKVTVISRLKDASGRIVAKKSEKVTVPAGESVQYTVEHDIARPHLWNGTKDPYLYTAELRIKGGLFRTLDKVSTEVGFRYFRADAQEGFFLNGQPYPLRGTSIHQDLEGKATALDASDYKADYEIVKELGANFVRLAHYPHNDRAFREADRLGLIVQTEIPWVNVCGVQAEPAYFDNLHQQLREMIGSLYNHPSIVFWGLWNEVDNWGNNNRYQGAFDAARAVKETALLYDEAKTLDPDRLVGVTDDSVYGRDGYTTLKGDFFSENRYHGWYYDFGRMDKLTENMTWIRDTMGVSNISEYGAGVNPFAHTWDEARLQAPENNFHFEEYGNRFHECHAQQIARMPWLTFTSIWILFDFPVANRKEGFTDSADGVNFTPNENRMYMNDKGLVTRDRKTKKDSFYLYKSWWNHDVETVYIAGRRLEARPAGQEFTLTVYSNAPGLTLYKNGTEIARQSASGDPTGVIWSFPVSMDEKDTVFEAVSEKGTRDRVSFKAL